MAPALIYPHNFKPGELSTSTFTHEAEAIRAQSALYSRSTSEANSVSGSGGVETNTIIFIVVGVGWSCLFIVPCYLGRRCVIALFVSPHDCLRDRGCITHGHLYALWDE